MPKNLIQESIRHHVLRGLQAISQNATPEDQKKWLSVSQTLEMDQSKDGNLVVIWYRPQMGTAIIRTVDFALYRSGDVTYNVEKKNRQAVTIVLREISAKLGLVFPNMGLDRFQREEVFHDHWASSIAPETVLVDAAFESSTAPENRKIVEILGNIAGKTLLDLGCGLGEGAVYFAKQGAVVTACDLSSEMLAKTQQVARYHTVDVTVHQASAESTSLPDNYFDIVYCANLLHHVDIESALDEIKRILKPDGIFITWDPLAHNPMINIYRRMASALRTSDEHPIHIEELKLFQARFREVRWQCFWFLTLAVFLRFYFLERVHPSKERYWKKILADADRLSFFYTFLEKWDSWILNRFPVLRKYCWNILIWGKK